MVVLSASAPITPDSLKFSSDLSNTAVGSAAAVQLYVAAVIALATTNSM